MITTLNKIRVYKKNLKYLNEEELQRLNATLLRGNEQDITELIKEEMSTHSSKFGEMPKDLLNIDIPVEDIIKKTKELFKNKKKVVN